MTRSSNPLAGDSSEKAPKHQRQSLTALYLITSSLICLLLASCGQDTKQQGEKAAAKSSSNSEQKSTADTTSASGTSQASQDKDIGEDDASVVRPRADMLKRFELGNVARTGIERTQEIPGRIEVDEKRITRIGASVTGRVVEVNWRATHINTGSGLEIIPNSVLAGQSFMNLSRPPGGRTITVTSKFSGADAPDDVCALLTDVAADLPQLHADSRPVTTVTGSADAETILAGRGEDVVNAGNGNDTISGGAGIDSLTGGGGADTFVYTTLSDGIVGGSSSARSFERIIGFTVGLDRFDVATAPPAGGFKTLGAVASLNDTGLTGLLNATNFVAHGAATFRFGSGTATRTFIAFNDASAGYNATADAVLELTSLSYASGFSSLSQISLV